MLHGGPTHEVQYLAKIEPAFTTFPTTGETMFQPAFEGHPGLPHGRRPIAETGFVGPTMQNEGLDDLIGIQNTIPAVVVDAEKAHRTPDYSS